MVSEIVLFGNELVWKENKEVELVGPKKFLNVFFLSKSRSYLSFYFWDESK